MTEEHDRRSDLERLVSPKKLGHVDFYTLRLKLPDGRFVTMEELLIENPNLVPIHKAKE